MRRPTLRSLPALDVAQWTSAAMVVAAGWGAGRGLAAGMDTAHCAAAGFAVSGSIFLAILLRETPARARRSA